MALSDSRLKTAIYGRLLTLFTQAENTEMTKETYADTMSSIIAEEIVNEITANAVVPSGIAVSTPDTINGSTTGTGTVT